MVSVGQTVALQADACKSKYEKKIKSLQEFWSQHLVPCGTYSCFWPHSCQLILTFSVLTQLGGTGNDAPTSKGAAHYICYWHTAVAEQPSPDLVICCLVVRSSQFRLLVSSRWSQGNKSLRWNHKGLVLSNLLIVISKSTFLCGLMALILLMPPKGGDIIFHELWTCWQFKKEIAHIRIYMEFRFFCQNGKD